MVSYGTSTNGKSKKRGHDGPRLVEGIKISQLTRSMRRSRELLQHFRQQRVHAVKLYCGHRWGNSGFEEEVPFNQLDKFVRVIGRALVPKEPRVMLSTVLTSSRPAVDGMESWINTHLEKTYFAEKLRRFVNDAFYCMGVMKVALASPANEAADYGNEAGAPHCEVVSLDDFAIDPGATSVEKAAWVAHRYKMDLERAKELEFFDPKVRKRLESGTNSSHNDEGDTRLSAMSRQGVSTTEDEYEESIEVWEVWLRRERKVLTIAATAGGGVPTGEDVDVLAVQDWVGPDCGPYHYLCFGIVPDNLIPKAPAMDMVPLVELVNRLYVKLGQQAERQKTFIPVRGGQTDDAGRLPEVPDGGFLPCDNADDMEERSTGGAHPGNTQFAIHVSDIINKQAGNLELLSGGAPQSKTASQDKMLNENASASVQDMQELTITATSKILSAYAWYLWYHPHLVMETTKAAPGVPDIVQTRRVYPSAENTGYGSQKDGRNRREGDYEQLHLRVDPYSLQHKTPQQRLAYIDAVVEKMMPIMPMLQQSGMTYDAQAHMKIRAKYADEPDLLLIFAMQEPIAPPEGTGSGGSRMPSETSREYVRRSVGQDTDAARQSELSNNLSAEAAAFGGESGEEA